MPIVNGSYVPDTLGDARQAQQQVFGSYSKRDMTDYSTAAYNYLMKQQEQAYNLELWNLTNEYNSPAAQMKRYQDAGLNPNLIYSQQNAANPPASSSAASFRPSGTMSKSVQNGLSAIQQIQNIVRTARDTYDYMKYGAESNRWSMINQQESALKTKMENSWMDWLLHGDNMIYGDASRLPYGPQAEMYKNQQNVQKWTYERLRLLCSLIPEQTERTKSLNALDQHREEIMRGQYEWILHGFDTGNNTLNAFLRTFLMFGMSSLF